MHVLQILTTYIVFLNIRTLPEIFNIYCIFFHKFAHFVFSAFELNDGSILKPRLITESRPHRGLSRIFLLLQPKIDKDTKFNTCLLISSTLFAYVSVVGASVAQWVKRWPTDLADRVRSSLDVKSS